jgi:hypothetical protein
MKMLVDLQVIHVHARANIESKFMTLRVNLFCWMQHASALQVTKGTMNDTNRR